MQTRGTKTVHGQPSGLFTWYTGMQHIAKRGHSSVEELYNKNEEKSSLFIKHI